MTPTPNANQQQHQQNGVQVHQQQQPRPRAHTTGSFFLPQKPLFNEQAQSQAIKQWEDLPQDLMVPSPTTRKPQQDQSNHIENKPDLEIETTINRDAQLQDEEEEILSDCSSLMGAFSRYQDLVQMISDSSIMPVLVVSEVGLIKSLNDQVTQLVEYPRWHLVNQNVKMLMEDRYARKHDHYLKRYKVSQQKRIIGLVRGGLRVLTQSGKTIPISLKVNTLSTGTGYVIIGTIQDNQSMKDLDWQQSVIRDQFPGKVVELLKSNQVPHRQCIGTVGTIEFFSMEQDKMTAKQAFHFQNKIHEDLDLIARRWQIEKLPSEMDQYSVCSGLLDKQTESHSIRVTKFLIEASLLLQEYQMNFRSSCATGEIRSGILGMNWKKTWDVLGPAVRQNHIQLQKCGRSSLIMNHHCFQRVKYLMSGENGPLVEELDQGGIKMGAESFARLVQKKVWR